MLVFFSNANTCVAHHQPQVGLLFKHESGGRYLDETSKSELEGVAKQVCEDLGHSLDVQCKNMRKVSLIG